MDKRTENLLDHLEANQPLAEFYAAGHTPADAREFAEILIGPYYDDRASLRDLPMEVLFPLARDIATVIRYGTEPVLVGTLKIYRASYRAAGVECLRVLLDEQKALSASLSVFWSAFHLDRDRTTLELEEFLHETLRVLGTFLEGLVKPVVVALATHVELASTVAPTSGKSFGRALELVESEFDERVFQIAGVRLNQWRNIAQHLSAAVDGDIIVCRYGTAGDKTVRVTREQLDRVLLRAVHAWTAMKAARQAFFIGRLEDIRQAGLDLNLPKERAEASFAVLAGALASQGFALLDASFTADSSDIVIQDMSSMPTDERALHASRAVFPLAQFFPASRLSITYRERDGTPALLAIAPLEAVRRAQEAGNAIIALDDMTLLKLKPAPAR